MELDSAICYRAYRSRDPRFDGRFFLGVRTTGIYCRPVCPAPSPKRENVDFFACAAAAEEAGFRPCRRCRPETAPGTPAWIGTSATVSRALRLIGEGALERGGIEDLAARLGVTSRHLRRLFTRHLGAAPLSIARTSQVHLARMLLDETDLSVTDVAFHSGFRSLRQFHHAVRATFRRSPTDLRRMGRRPREDARGLVVRLAYRPPLDWGALLEFLAARATPGVEEIASGVYRRTVSIDGARGVLAACPIEGSNALRVEIELAEPRRLLPVVERVRRIFDLGSDPNAIAAILEADPRLRPIVSRPGLRVPGAWDGFELAVRAVLGQQVSVRGATTLAGRLAAAFGESLPVERANGLRRLFPSPPSLADVDVAKIGIPGARARTIRELSRAVAEGRLALDASVGLDEATRCLESIPGIGAWTAHYVAMRALREPDAFPAGDLGIRKALARGGPLPSEREVEAISEAWRPWRAYAAITLWASLRPGREVR